MALFPMVTGGGSFDFADMQITGKYLSQVYNGTTSGTGFTVGNYLFVPISDPVTSTSGLTLVWSNTVNGMNRLYIYRIDNSSISLSAGNWVGGFEVVKP